MKSIGGWSTIYIKSNYSVVLLYDVTSSIDSVFTWVSLNEFIRRKQNE